VQEAEEISQAFYAELGADGLASRTRPEWDEKIVSAVVEMLPPKARVLDVGCGYGRVALPLARAGYEVEGLDLSENLIAAAQRAADARGLPIDLIVGSMAELPYSASSFDVVICLWSAFNEVLDEDAQVRTISEMWRVLRPGGFALIEGMLYEEASAQAVETGARSGPEHRVALGSRGRHLEPALLAR
jgi:2-polyprenyl-3-methyl-5-hydroxy-6-metoxy-1,4-benzoquinol methylase